MRSLNNRNGPSQGLHPRPTRNTPLHIVAFKCNRTDVFYIPSDIPGLEVKEGDLVIVEADRGQDLGTVVHSYVDWERARALRDQGSEEHFRWLMMFSSYNHNGGMLANSGSQSHPMNAAMASNGRSSGIVDATRASGELKPKVIKCHANPQQISNLQVKEGMEARAKRICQQKANEYGMQMEILDAEMQK